MINVHLDTLAAEPIKIDGKISSFNDFDSIIQDIIVAKNIDIKEYSITNKYLRVIRKVGDYEYHFLEKPAGIHNIYCRDSDLRKKTLKIDMPYTIMVIKMQCINGKYIKKADRIFHSDGPIKKDLSNDLWRWGLSNVYDQHYICWGKEKMPDIDNQISFQYMDEFFLGIKNNDLIRNSKIKWESMSSDTVHKLTLNDTPKLNFKLSEIFGINDF